VWGQAPRKSSAHQWARHTHTLLWTPDRERGHGDVTPVERWWLLGPLTAMNGVLLFGWSTAVIFEVLRRTVRFGAAASPTLKEWGGGVIGQDDPPPHS
jgi:hypothetical protein